MKHMIFTLMALLLVVDSAISQNPAERNNFDAISLRIWKRAPENYLQGLKKNNLGVVESSIINLMKLRRVYPEGDYTEIISELETLQANGKTKSIRFMAYIAHNYFQSPERFSWLTQTDLTHMDSTLAMVRQRLHAMDD